jgi:hypothetical protein
VAFVRTVKTASGARAVQIVYSRRKGSRKIEHIGSAHDEVELELLKAVARQRIAAGQEELDLGVAAPPESGGPLPITASRMGHLWDALSKGYDVLGFDIAADGDEVFRSLVLARIIEPTSKLDSLRVLEEIGIAAPSYATVKRRLPDYGGAAWRERLATLCAAHVGLGPANLVLFDVTTLYFETDTGDGFREPGFSKERRLEPQITIGLLSDAAGFPLMVSAFEGNKAETTTMLPTITAFMAAHRLTDVTIVADAGMVSEANRNAIDEAQLSYILGAKMPFIPYVVEEWRRTHAGEPLPDGLTLTQPWPATDTQKTQGRRDKLTYYRYTADRARRTLHGIDEQVGKAEKAVAGKVPVKRNRFITLAGGQKSVNRDLEAKARALAGWKGYITNINQPTPEFVIGAYHRLFQIERSFRMAKSDLAARPIYHRTRDSIEAHLTIVFAALAVSHWIENTTGWSIKKFVKTMRRYRTINIQAGDHTITAADPLPADAHTAIEAIRTRQRGH